MSKSALKNKKKREAAKKYDYWGDDYRNIF
jgi:hypothetical protein